MTLSPVLWPWKELAFHRSFSSSQTSQSYNNYYIQTTTKPQPTDHIWQKMSFTTKLANLKLDKTPMRPLTVLPFNPDLATGSFEQYPIKKHSSFWGTYKWPFDCYDPWDKDNPRHRVFQRRTNTKSAEDFMNIYELRHLLYSNIPELELSQYTGLFMSCKTIADEVSAKYLTPRRQYTAAQRTHWSNEYSAPVLITEPLKFDDLAIAEVQLQASMFTQEWLSNNPQSTAADIYAAGIPMSDSYPSVAHLKISTYIDTPDRVDPDLIKMYAQAIDDSLGANTACTKVSFNWGTIMPGHEWYMGDMAEVEGFGFKDWAEYANEYLDLGNLNGWMYWLSGEGHVQEGPVVVITWKNDPGWWWVRRVKAVNLAGDEMVVYSAVFRLELVLPNG